MLTVGQRIRYLREKKNISLSTLAELTDLKKSGLSSYENDRYEPSAKAIVALSKALNTSTDWLLTGEDKTGIDIELSQQLQNFTDEDREDLDIFLQFLDLRRQKKKIKNASKQYTILTEEDPPIAATKEEPTIYLPILGDAAAGIPIEIIEMRQGEVPVNEKHGKYNSFVIRAKGNSMIEAGIDNGDLVVIRPQPIVENGEIALVNINGEATIKYFYLHNGKCELKSANPSYSPMLFTSHDISILGKVVEVIKHK